MRPGDSAASDLLASARALRPWLVDVRRDLHRHPELGWDEHRTGARILEMLAEIGADATGGVARTGVVATLHGRAPGRTIALRADIDALPIHDAKDVDYRSTVDGRMHACGHDAHTTIALGAARLLADRLPDLDGAVRLIFEPAEETDGGAAPLVEAGALENPRVDAIFGLHVEPGLEVGTIGLHPGQRNAASDRLAIRVIGRSGHGAYPATGVDAIVAAAHVVTALQTVVSRNVDAREAAVVTLGTVSGGTAPNILAGEVELTGTIRTVDAAVRRRVAERVRQVAKGAAQALGARAIVSLERDYEPVVNDDDALDVVRSSARELVGPDRVVEFSRPNMGVEDFGVFLRHVPGAYWSLGIRNTERGIVHPLHHELFDLDEDALVLGAAMQALNVLRALEASDPC